MSYLKKILYTTSLGQPAEASFSDMDEYLPFCQLWANANETSSPGGELDSLL